MKKKQRRVLKKKMKRIRQLPHTTIMEIYNKKKGGLYYDIELCREYQITRYTLEKVVEKVETLIKETIYKQ